MAAVVDNRDQFIHDNKGDFCLATNDNVGTLFKETWQYWLFNELKKLSTKICVQLEQM